MVKYICVSNIIEFYLKNILVLVQILWISFKNTLTGNIKNS